MKTMHSRQTMENDSQIAGEPVPNLLLRSTRKQNRWTQQEVAKKLGVGVASVGRWERGEVVPNRYDRDLLCELFHRSAEELGFPGGQEIPVSADSQEPNQPEKEASKSNRLPFHVQLRYERERRGWSQADLAAKVDSDPKTVARWERGAGTPHSYHRKALCALFELNAEEFGLEEFELEEARKSKRLPFHVQLRYQRELRGWSQEDVGSRIDSDPKTVARWERGSGLPRPYHRQKLCQLFNMNAEEFGLTETTATSRTVPASASLGGEARSFHTTRTFSVDLPVHCGDCEQPGITGMLETMVIDPRRDCTTFYFRFTNRTAEDAGLKFDSLSLIAPNGDFFLGRSVGSFLLGAGQSIPLSAVFDWIPQRKAVYRLNVVLIRPNRWRNTYRPISLTV